MPIDSIRTVGFRNLVDGEIGTRSSDVFLVGENGQGKSNFLEAVYFCSYASTFRACRENDVIRTGEKDCAVSAKLSGRECDSVSVKFVDGKKTVQLDGKRIDDRKILLETISPIVFCHDDMDFVSGPPEKRRWFFDQSLSIYDVLYIDELRKYRKVLKTRNAVLKERKTSLLDVIDEQLSFSGLRLMEKRRIAAEYFSAAFIPLFQAVSGISAVSIKYSPSWKADEVGQVRDILCEKRDSDTVLGTTMSGPHRDRYVFVKDGMDFASKASTGQRRLLSLLLRVTQASRYSDILKKKPILLLDDVLLELDPEKRKRFLGVLPEYDQAFFTFLPEEPYERYLKRDTIVYCVEAGVVKA